MLRPEKKVCEDCIHYGFIDSGYGFCRRFPPTLEITNLGNLFKHIFISFKREYIYPTVAWCDYACGEFKTTHRICKVKKKNEQQ